MSEPKITLAGILAEMRSRPRSAEQDLAALDFLELPDSEQKDILFRAVCELSAQVNYLMSRK